MRKGLMNGVKLFFVSFSVLFILNVIGIRVLSDFIYTTQGITLAFLWCVVLGVFVRL
jgi:hypothetical protein